MTSEELDEGDVALLIELSEFFGFCGCGLPEDALEHVLKSLEILKRRTDACLDSTTWKLTVAELEAHARFEVSSGLAYQHLYLLASKGLTEHGGSIGGCWLSSKGREVLEKLEAWQKTRKPEGVEHQGGPSK